MPIKEVEKLENTEIFADYNDIINFKLPTDGVFDLSSAYFTIPLNNIEDMQKNIKKSNPNFFKT